MPSVGHDSSTGAIFGAGRVGADRGRVDQRPAPAAAAASNTRREPVTLTA